MIRLYILLIANVQVKCDISPLTPTVNPAVLVQLNSSSLSTQSDFLIYEENDESRNYSFTYVGIVFTLLLVWSGIASCCWKVDTSKGFGQLDGDLRKEWSEYKRSFSASLEDVAHFQCCKSNKIFSKLQHLWRADVGEVLSILLQSWLLTSTTFVPIIPWVRESSYNSIGWVPHIMNLIRAPRESIQNHPSVSLAFWSSVACTIITPLFLPIIISRSCLTPHHIVSKLLMRMFDLIYNTLQLLLLMNLLFPWACSNTNPPFVLGSDPTDKIFCWDPFHINMLVFSSIALALFWFMQFFVTIWLKVDQAVLKKNDPSYVGYQYKAQYLWSLSLMRLCVAFSVVFFGYSIIPSYKYIHLGICLIANIVKLLLNWYLEPCTLAMLTHVTLIMTIQSLTCCMFAFIVSVSPQGARIVVSWIWTLIAFVQVGITPCWIYRHNKTDQAQRLEEEL